MNVIQNPASEFLRLRQVSEECRAALEFLARAQAAKEGEAFAHDVMAASCSIGAALGALNRSLTRVTRSA